MVVRLEGSREITCILRRLSSLTYEIVKKNERVAFIYKKGINSNKIRRDIRTAKDACKSTASISLVYGLNNIFM